MKFWLVVVLMGSVLLVGPRPATAAASIQMSARAGFDGLGKIGGWLPIEVDIRNDGPDVDGELQLVVTDTAANRSPYTRAPTTYTAPAVLARRSHKRLQLEVDLRSTSQKIQARLVEQGGTVIVEQDVPVNRISAGDLLCGVLSRSGPSFDFLSSLELPAPLRRARIAHVEVAELPNRPQLLSALDCLIFDNIATGAMLQSQRDAVSIWVNNGGLLVVIGGPTWQRTVSALPPELLPVKMTGLASLDSLSALEEFEQTPLAVQGPWLVSQASLTDGAMVLEQDGVPLIAAARRGLGTVLYLAVDPTQEPLRSWPGAPGLWRYVLSHGAGGVGSISSVSAGFAGWGRMPRAALVDVSSVVNPSSGWLMFTLAAYALVVGPLNLLFLWKAGRLGWSVVTVPLITVVGAFCAFGVASSVQDSELVVNKVSMVRANGQGPAVSRTYVSVLSRKQGEFDIRAPDNAVVSALYYPFPRDPAADPQSWSLRVASGGAPTVSDFQLAPSNLGTFLVDSQAAFAGRMETDLRVEGRSLVGSVTNSLGVPLYDAAVVIDYDVVRLGDFKAGESRDVTIPLAATAKAGFGPPSQFANLLYPGPGSFKRPGDVARRDILDNVFGSGFNFVRLELAGPTLLGWVDTAAVNLEVPGARPVFLENTLYLGTIPIGVPKGFEGELPSSTFSRRQLGAATLNRQQFGSYELAPGESVALQFSLPVANGRFLMDGLYINAEGRLRGPANAQPAIGEVSIYNWRAAEWEDRGISFGRNLLRNPQAYVSASGDVRLRYTFRPDASSGATGVTFTRLDVSASGLMR